MTDTPDSSGRATKTLTREQLDAIAERDLDGLLYSHGVYGRVSMDTVERDALVAMAQRTEAEGGCSVAHAVHIPEQEFHHLMRSRDELAQQLIEVQDEAAEIAGREEAHLNQIEQMRMRAEQAERTLAAIQAIDNQTHLSPGMRLEAIHRLLQEG